MELTDDIKQQIVDLYKSCTITQISKLTGIKIDCIKQVLNETGVEIKRGRRSIDRSSIRIDYENGNTEILFLADKYNCSPFTMYRILDELKLPRPHNRTTNIINAIMQTPNAKMSRIAEQFGVSRQFVYKCKRKLIKDGLIENALKENTELHDIQNNHSNEIINNSEVVKSDNSITSNETKNDNRTRNGRKLIKESIKENALSDNHNTQSMQIPYINEDVNDFEDINGDDDINFIEVINGKRVRNRRNSFVAHSVKGIRATDEFWKYIKNLSAKEGLSLATFIIIAVNEYYSNFYCKKDCNIDDELYSPFLKIKNGVLQRSRRNSFVKCSVKGIRAPDTFWVCVKELAINENLTMNTLIIKAVILYCRIHYKE